MNPKENVMKLNESFVKKQLTTLRVAFAFFTTIVSTTLLQAQSNLYFDGYTLIEGIDQQVGAKYRFHQVVNSVDAIVTIDSLVGDAEIKDIDQKGPGHDCAFQPFIKAPGGSAVAYGVFTIEFVDKDTYNPKVLDQVLVTPIDIDGNDKLKEFCDVDMMGGSAIFSGAGTDISVTSGYFGFRGKNVAGIEYAGIDTLGNGVMFTVTKYYVQKMILRAGTETNNASTVVRQHSFYMKGFPYINPVVLPVILTHFSATLKNDIVSLKWEAEKEDNFSHYMLERSYNGNGYEAIATVFGNGQYGQMKYAHTDASVNPQKGMAYYRLLMVDKDGKTKYSEVKLIRFSKQKENLSITTYPNPVSNELRITIPANWQGKEVKFDIFNSNGQLVRTIRNGYASQTETITVNNLAKGYYVVKAATGTEAAQQSIIKN